MTVISVVTPTWRRHQLLMERCIPSVLGQTFPKVEHVIVSDGPDPQLGAALSAMRPPRPSVFIELAEHLPGPVDYGSRPRNMGAAAAGGDLIAYLDDDNAYRPEHLALLAAVLETNPHVDFAYSQMLTHPAGDMIGSAPPLYGHIDTSLLMHRVDTLGRFGRWPTPDELDIDKHAPDWGVVQRWLVAGATWVHVPQVTVDYWSS